MATYLSSHTGAQIDNAVNSVLNGTVDEAVRSLLSNWQYSLEVSDASSPTELILNVKGLTPNTTTEDLRVFLYRYGRKNKRGAKGNISFGWRHPKDYTPDEVFRHSLHQLIPSAYHTEWPILDTSGEVVIGDCDTIIKPFLHFSSKVIEGEGNATISFRAFGKNFNRHPNNSEVSDRSFRGWSGKTRSIGFAVVSIDGDRFTRVSEILEVQVGFSVVFSVSSTEDNTLAGDPPILRANWG